MACWTPKVRKQFIKTKNKAHQTMILHTLWVQAVAKIRVRVLLVRTQYYSGLKHACPRQLSVLRGRVHMGQTRLEVIQKLAIGSSGTQEKQLYKPLEPSQGEPRQPNKALGLCRADWVALAPLAQALRACMNPGHRSPDLGRYITKYGCYLE